MQCKEKLENYIINNFPNYSLSSFNLTMSQSNPIFDYKSESQAEKLARKSKDSPFMIIGILGLIGVCGFGAYKFKSRGEMSTSVFLMQLRVAAQGTVVSALTIGLVYQLAHKYMFKEKKE